MNGSNLQTMFFRRTYGKPYQKEDKMWIFLYNLANQRNSTSHGMALIQLHKKILNLITKILPRRTKKIARVNRLKPFKARLGNDDQPVRRSTKKEDFFAEPPPVMAPVSEFKVDEEPAANETEPERAAAVDAIEEQPVIVADKRTTLTIMNSVDIREQHDDQ